jgi:hypothetical protein
MGIKHFNAKFCFKKYKNDGELRLGLFPKNTKLVVNS